MSRAMEEVIECLQAAAAHFYSLRPPLILESLQCLQAVLSVSPPQRTQARTLLQVSHLLYQYCDNSDELSANLEQCRLLCQSLGSMDQVKFPCLHLLAKAYLSSGHTQRAKQVLKAALDESEDKPFWHATFLFQLADFYRAFRDLFHSTLSRGVKYCEKNAAPIPHCYFLLMQQLHLNTDLRFKEAVALSQDLFSRLEKLEHPSCILLKASHHTISLLSGLQLGQILTCKAHLKELQMFAREISHSNTSDVNSSSELIPATDNFTWIQRDNLFQLVYLISMLHPMLSGAIDKAVGYADKALGLISQQTQLLQAQPWEGLSGENVAKRLADHFQTLVLHNLCVCKIVKGSLSEVPSLLQQIESLRMRAVDTHAHHFLTGLYLFAQDRYKLALSHFNSALDTSKTGSHPDVFLQVQTLVHVCLCYVKLGPQYYDSDVMTQVMGRLRTVRNSQLPQEALNLKAAANFVVGLHQALLQSLPEAKSALKEAVVLANTEDLHKLVSCTLILLGKVFMAIGKKEEAGSMIPPAHQLASKIQDADLQIWACTLMAEFCQSVGEEALHRDTLATRQQKLSIRMTELQEVLRKEDGSISMIGWTREEERGRGQVEGEVKSPCSPVAKRVCVADPFSPKMEKEEEAPNLKIESDKENHFFQKDMLPHRQGVRDTIHDSNPPNHTIRNNVNHHHNRDQSETPVPTQVKKTVPSNVYSSPLQQEQSSELNGSYQESMHQLSDANSHTFQSHVSSAPMNISSESPLRQSCQPHPMNGMHQDSQNSTPQPNSGSSELSYHMQARRASDLSNSAKISYYPQPSPACHQIPSQPAHYSPRPNPQTQNLGIRLLEQAEWRGEAYEAPLTSQQQQQQQQQQAPYLGAGTAEQSCQYQNFLQQQQQLARQFLLCQQQSGLTESTHPQQVQLEQSGNSYPSRQGMLELSCQKVPTPPTHNSMEHVQHIQIPTEQAMLGYPTHPVMEQSQVKPQIPFEVDSSVEPGKTNPPRQPFQLQSLLQSAPINTISPEKRNKRPRVSPDPLILPTSPHPPISRPIGVLPQGMMSPLVIQNYPHSSTSARLQQNIPYSNAAIQGFYNKNMGNNFGQYFLPRGPFILPQNPYYPPSQLPNLDPSLLQMHPKHREK